VANVLPSEMFVRMDTPSTLSLPLVVSSCCAVARPKEPGKVVALKTGSVGLAMTAVICVKRNAAVVVDVEPGVAPDCAVKAARLICQRIAYDD
jgi:hypothetical protein